MFYLQLDEFTHPCTGGCKKTDHEVPECFLIPFQAFFEIGVICFTDYIFKECFLLNPDKRKFPFVFFDAFQITVQRTQTKVDCLRLIVFYKPNFVSTQFLGGDSIVLSSISICLRQSLVPFSLAG